MSHSSPSPGLAAPQLSRRERALKFVLRAVGIFDLLALVAVVMPLRWSAVAHRWLGLGPLPEAPIVEYLIRSLSMMYALQAVFMIYLSMDVRGYRRLIQLFGALAVVNGTVLGMVDWHADLPTWWRIQEPLAFWTIGGVLLLLSAKSNPAP